MTGFNIENIVVSATIADSLDLDLVAKTFPDSKYNPSETSMVIIHRTTPTPAAVMLFPNGTLMCTGIKTMQDAEDIIRTTTKILNTAGVPTRENPEMKIQTLVTSQDLHKKLDLQSIAKTLGTNKTEYDPKQFPGLIYKKEGNNTVVLLFDSGKMVCTGTNSDDISHALEQLTNELSSCKMI